MAIAEKSFIFPKLIPSSQILNKNVRKFCPTSAKKRDLSETSKPQKKPIFPLRISSSFLAQSAIAVFGLGFIDAGYSGDWSRIGVISKESEELLKVAAFIVVPLCLFLVIYLSKEREA
ncbi:hypothetical protein UlMin_002828 [Ulmus minor]